MRPFWWNYVDNIYTCCERRIGDILIVSADKKIFLFDLLQRPISMTVINEKEVMDNYEYIERDTYKCLICGQIRMSTFVRVHVIFCIIKKRLKA